MKQARRADAAPVLRRRQQAQFPRVARRARGARRTWRVAWFLITTAMSAMLLAGRARATSVDAQAQTQTQTQTQAQTQTQTQAPQQPTLPTLTLADCLRLGLQNNLGLRITQQQQLVAASQQRIALTQLLPRFSLQGNGSAAADIESGRDATTLDGSLVVVQPLYHGAAIWSQWKQSGLNERQARLALERLAQSVVRDTKTRWFELLEHKALRQEAAGAVDRLRQHVENAKHFFDAGRIWRNDVLQAQVELARGEQALIASENRYRVAMSRLNVLMRRDVGDDFSPVGELVKPPASDAAFGFEAALVQARAQRPDLRAAQLTVEHDAYGIGVARAGLLPNLDAQASLGAQRQPGTSIAPADVRGSAAALLTLTWDIWEWGKTPQRIDAAAAQQQQSALRLQALQDDIALQVQQAWLGVVEATARVDVLERALEQAMEQYRVTKVRYEEQLGTANDVLIAQTLLTNTRSEYFAALAALLRAHAELEFAQGTPGP